MFQTPKREQHDVALTPLSQLPAPTPPPAGPEIQDALLTPASLSRPESVPADVARSTPPGSPDWPASPDVPMWDAPTPEAADAPVSVPMDHAPLNVQSGVRELDEMAGRGTPGFPGGSAIEVTGPPGCGKSALCVQMAIDHRLHHVLEQLESHARVRASSAPPSSASHELFSGAYTNPRIAESLDAWLDIEVLPHCGQVLLIDTEGGLGAARIVDAVNAVMTPDVVRRMAACVPLHDLLPSLQRAILLGVHVVRVLSLGELIAFIGAAASAETILPQRTSLIVLDSLSTFFHLGALPQGMSREQWRARSDARAHVLDGLYALRRLSDNPSMRVSVTVTTSMYTRSLGDGNDVMVPVGVESRPSTATAACEWGASSLNNAWRVVLLYHRVRYKALYIQSAPPAACAAIHPEPVHRCIPIHVTVRCC